MQGSKSYYKDFEIDAEFDREPVWREYNRCDVLSLIVSGLKLSCCISDGLETVQNLI